MLKGLLWILRTGAQWKDLPERYPPDQTCHRRFPYRVRSGVSERLPQALATDLQERGALARSACFIDGPVVVAKKGGAGGERPSGVRVRRPWQLQTAPVFLSPSAVRLLRRMKSPVLQQLSPSVVWRLDRNI